MKKGLLNFIFGLVVGVGGYIFFDGVLTPDATVIDAVEGTELYSGTFMDADPLHKAMGSFTITADGMGGRMIMLSNDFMVANAPDPHVMINGTLIAKNMFQGGQVFPIPNLIDEHIDDVRIFCEIAGVDLAHSTLMMEEVIITLEDMNMPMDDDMDMDMDKKEE